MKACIGTGPWKRRAIIRLAERKKRKEIAKRARRRKKNTNQRMTIMRPQSPHFDESPKLAVTQIKSLELLLPDLKRFIEDPAILRTGVDRANFKSRPREILVNWIYCAVGNATDPNFDLTFCTDVTGGDGILKNRKTEEIQPTEHVMVYSHKPTTLSLNDQIIAAIKLKTEQGEKYARKFLMVFCYETGSWEPSVVAANIPKDHVFHSIWIVALESSGADGHRYSLTELDPKHSKAPTWRLQFNADFAGWTVEQPQ